MKTYRLLPRLFTAFGLVMALGLSVWGDGGANNSCDGEQISELHTISTTTTRNETGTLYDGPGTDDDDDYYYFTPGIAGTLTYSYTSDRITDLRIEVNTCDGTRVLNDGTSVSGSLAVSSIGVVYIRIKREQDSATTNYSLNMTFTPTVVAQVPPIMGVIPNQTTNVEVAYSLNIGSFVTLTNGDPILEYNLTGTLPAGLSFNTGTGVISGTPTTAGTVTLSVTATDNDGVSNTSSFTITVVTPPVASGNVRPFTKRLINGLIDTNIRGNLLMIGNQLLCQNSANGATCTEPNALATNNAITQNFANIDTTTTTTGIVNSSMMRLDLLPGDKIIWARLYWSARLNNPTTATKLAAEKIKFRTPTATTYTEIPAQVFDSYPLNNPFDYGASADVTNLVKAGGAGQYYGANIQASTGTNQFASWMLLVVVENQVSRTLNNISIYDGFQVVYDDGAGGYPTSATATATGFLTPKSGPVTSNLFLYTGESESGIFDGATITNKSGTPTDLLDAKNSATDLMNGSFSTNGVYRSASRLSDPGLANPNWQNLIGTDIDKLTVTNIENSQTSTNIVVRSTDIGAGADKYSLNMFAFETGLYEPKLCYDYSLKQDGRFLSINRTNPIAHVSQSISSSPLELLVYLRNKEADITAQGISIKTDLNASRFSYTMTNPMYVSNPNGSALISRGVPALNSPVNCVYNSASGNAISDQGCVATFPNGDPDDLLRVRKGDGSLGSEEYIYTKFILKPEQIGGVLDDVNESLGLSIDYYIIAGGTVIPYTNYTLGTSSVPMCSPVANYQPSWGLFNVVERGQTPPILNNIKTKISRKAFDVDLAYDATPSTGTNDVPGTAGTPVGPINTSVLVEMIDVDSFGDINASCANPDAGVSTPIVVNNMNITSINNMTPIMTQPDSYYNFALKNGAFRVWYFTETNGTLIQNWSTSNASATNLYLPGTTTASGLFKSASHGDCNSSCGVTGGNIASAACFTCMKDYYGKPLCSRDNFSVRPEAFDIRIKDFNAAGVATDLSHNVYGFAPDTTPTSSRMSLAAGYEYKYDVNATGHEESGSGLMAVPRYTRYFNGANPDYNITMGWDSNLTLAKCNDIAPRSLKFFIADGARVDQLEPLDQVGDYRLNMIDTSWTAVDQITTNANRTAVRGFDISTDCDLSTDSTVMVGGEYGCKISSQHPNGALQYKDQLIAFKPAKFDLTGITYGLGMTPASIVAGGQGFVYMSDLNNISDMNMSVRSKGQIRAVGANGIVTTNFVGGCFAKELNITSANDANLTYVTPFVTRMINSTIANVQTYDSFEVNRTSNLVGTINDSNFTKVDTGALMNSIRFNFDRNQTTPFEKQVVTYSDINVTCAVSVDCNQSSMRLDDANRSSVGIAQGSSLMNFNVTHVYGRLVPNDARVMGLIPFETIARYEVYMTPNLLGTALLPDPIDPTWNINTLHMEADHGNATVGYVDPIAGSSLPLGTSTYAPGTETYRFAPFTIRKNYKGHIDTEGWLWYNQNALAYSDPSAVNLSCLTHPCFNIIFGRLIGNTGSAKTESEAHKANKKTSTGTGWSTTSEYAPAIR